MARIVGLAGHSIPIFWLGLMALFVFYAKLQVGRAPRGGSTSSTRAWSTPMTGLAAVDTAIQGEWDVFRDALAPHHPAGRDPRLLFRRLYQPHDAQLHAGAARARNTSSPPGPRGVSRRQVVWRHAFKNIRVQLLTILALTFGGLLDGAVLIETVFGWPGLGQYLTRGLQMNDMNVVMGAVLLIGVVFLTINIVSDRLYRILDPRTR